MAARGDGVRGPSEGDIEERAVFSVMRNLAARSRALATDAKRYERDLAALVRSSTTLDEPGIGPISAAKLLASDPTRFKHEAAFAPLQRDCRTTSLSGKRQAPT